MYARPLFHFFFCSYFDLGRLLNLTSPHSPFFLGFVLPYDFQIIYPVIVLIGVIAAVNGGPGNCL